MIFSPPQVGGNSFQASAQAEKARLSGALARPGKAVVARAPPIAASSPAVAALMAAGLKCAWPAWLFPAGARSAGAT